MNCYLPFEGNLMKQKLDLKKLQKKGYRFSIIGGIKGNALVAACILCDSQQDIAVDAFWVNDKEKSVRKYFLCKNCGDEFFNLSESDRESIVEKIIEKKIASLPHRKMSELFGGKNVQHK